MLFNRVNGKSQNMRKEISRESYSRRCCVLLALLMAPAVVCLGQSDTDWPGWRGLSKQGRSEANGPTTWSDDSNVAWKTSLPGQGHSSPVVVGDDIIVTAAYSVAHGQNRQTGMYILVALALLLVGSSAPYILLYYRSEDRQKKGQFRSMLMFCLLIGLLLHALALLCLEVSNTDHRSHYAAWLQSFILVGTGIAVVIMGLPDRSRYRIILGILAMVLVAPLILLRPNPGYYVLWKKANYHLPATYLCVTMLISIGSASLIGAFLRRRKSENGSNQQVNPDDSTQFLLPLAAFVLAFACGFLGPWVALHRFPGWFWRPYVNRETLVAVSCSLCIALWCLMQVFSKRLPPARPHRWFSPGVLTLVVLCLLVANYVGREESYVRAILCIDRTTGTIKWQREGLTGPKATTHKDNSPASPTPLIHRGKVYAYFGAPGLMCTDMRGNLLWSDSNLPYKGIHGVGSSLVADNDHIIVTSTNSRAPYITALHAETGTRLWTAKLDKWSGIHGEHRTPLIAYLHDTKVLLNWCKRYLAAMEVDSGRELWGFQTEGAFKGEPVATIIQKDNTLYLPSQGDFAAIDISALGNGGSAREIWRTNMRGKGPVTSSPVLHKGLIFMVSDRAYASCLSADSGKLLWQEKLLRGAYYASPIVMGENVYFFNRSGVTTVVACDSTFKQVAQNVLPSDIYATPAPVDGRLYIRTTTGLWCIE